MVWHFEIECGIIVYTKAAVEAIRKKSMGKIFKKGLGILGIVLLVAIVCLLVIELWYLPHYWVNQKEVATNNNQGDEITLMSCNVRCFALDDLFKKSWFYRADLIASNISQVQPDIIGFQEVTWLHYGYLQEIMPGYDSVITYRDDFILSEGCPIFYRTDKFELIDKGSFWLSETPDVMSKDWGSAYYRICSYTILKQKSNGKSFVVFNTHLDNVSDQARIKGISVVLKKIQQFNDLPAFMMGDFNAKPNSETLNAITQHFDDAQIVAPITEDGCTYQDWGAKLNAVRIDYIVASKGKMTISEYGVCKNLYDGIYPSDHFPIYIKATLK